MEKIKRIIQSVAGFFRKNWQKTLSEIRRGKKERIRQTSIMKRTFATILRISKLISIAAVGAVLVHNVNMEMGRMKMQNMVHDQYIQTDMYNLYVDDESIAEEQLAKIKNVYARLPKDLMDKVNNEWVILVSETCPFDNFTTDGIIQGTTYYAMSIVWLAPDATEHQITHEFGHILSFLCGEIHNSTTFVELHKKYWATYPMCTGETIEGHCVSNSSEWFAEMYAEYIMYPEHFKTHMPDTYSFMLNLRENNWRLTSVGEQLSITDRMFRIVYTKASTWCNNQLFYIKNFGNEIGMLFHPKVNPDVLQNTYNSTFKFKETSQALSLVQDVVNNPQNYEDVVRLYIDDPKMDLHKLDEVQTVMSFYFLNTQTTIADYGVEYDGSNFHYSYVFNKQTLLELESQRLLSLANVDKVLLNEIKSGTEKQMLMQVMSYMLTYITNTNDVNEVDAAIFWDGHISNDISMAMVFQQFAHRLGIACDIVISPLDNGQNHIFNRVTLNDGTYVYYDVIHNTAHAEGVEHDNLIVYGINSNYR